MKQKPALSFWQIWNMCFGFLGIQFGFALQNANVSRIFQTLGAAIEDLPILWVAAPLTGLIVQPIIGYMSDRTWNRLGRRRREHGQLALDARRPSCARYTSERPDARVSSPAETRSSIPAALPPRQSSDSVRSLPIGFLRSLNSSPERRKSNATRTTCQSRQMRSVGPRESFQ